MPPLFQKIFSKISFFIAALKPGTICTSRAPSLRSCSNSLMSSAADIYPIAPLNILSDFLPVQMNGSVWRSQLEVAAVSYAADGALPLNTASFTSSRPVLHWHFQAFLRCFQYFLQIAYHNLQSSCRCSLLASQCPHLID